MNEPLQKGDRVQLLAMPNDPSPVPLGTRGTVKSVSNFQGIIYGMNWDNGSTLNLLDGVDSWRKLETPKF